MRLHHVPNTRSSSALWLLEEAGAEYELVVLPLAPAERRTAEHLARHPLGKVPVLEDGEGALYESGAVCLRLAELHPGLAPPARSHERGLLYQWMFFTVTELEPALSDVLVGAPAAAAAARPRLERVLDALERALRGRDHLLGAFSAADALAGPSVIAAGRAGLLDGHPALSAYGERLTARPAYRRAFGDGGERRAAQSRSAASAATAGRQRSANAAIAPSSA